MSPIDPICTYCPDPAPYRDRTGEHQCRKHRRGEDHISFREYLRRAKERIEKEK